MLADGRPGPAPGWDMVDRNNAKPTTGAARDWRYDRVSATGGSNFFRALIENVGDIVALLDRNGTVLYQSAAVMEVLGHEIVPPVGHSVLDSVHPEDRERMRERIAICARTPDWMSMETFRLRHRDGSWRWMEARAKNMLDDPEVGAILCISRDVTQTRRLEQQLREAEQLARFGHWRWAKNEPAPRWSDGAAKILDRPAQSMPTDGDWHRDLIHPEDQEALLSKLLEVFDTKESIIAVSRYRSGDGGYRHIKTYAYAEFDASEEIGALFGLVEDVTEQVHAEEALRHSEARYRLLAEQASDIVHHATPAGEIIFISPSVEGTLGYPLDELLQMSNLDEILHPEDRERVVMTYRELATSRETLRVEFRLRHKAGNYVWLESTLRGVRGPDGSVSEIVGITRDVSERKRNEIELMEARERAETASHTKSRFLANMSHELRTPLNAIIGFSEMLKLQMFGELGHSRYREYAQLINESGALLLDLINDILDMSKIEAGKYELHHERIDICEVVQGAARLVQGRAEDGGLLLDVDIPADVAALPLQADARALKQILLNLLSNAIKFTPAGGRVIVAVRRRDGAVSMSVTDTGQGIPAEDISRLGQPFEQASSDASLSKQGTGLGLALVRSLAELHGGTFRIESELGQGTTVEVALPLVPRRHATIAAQ